MEAMANFIPFKAPGLSGVMQFLRKNFLILLILVLAAFMRLYHIGDYITFLGDEGRDVLVVKGILEGKLVFLGPRASAGDFFLGPLYYYMMAPFLLLWRFDPVGPAVMVALFGIATVYLVFLVGKEFFGRKAGYFAAALYAVSPLVLIYSRSSWNPNPVPFFTLLMLWVLYKGVRAYSWKLFFLAGILYGVLIQLHYIVVFLAVIIFLFLLLAPIIEKKFSVSRLLKQFLLMGAGFLVALSPFLAFEIKNQFPNIKTIFGFMFSSTVTKEEVGAPFMSIVQDVFVRVFARLIYRFPQVGDFEHYTDSQLQIWQVVAIITALIALFLVYKAKNRVQMVLLGLWFILGVTLFGFYKKPIHDYYFSFLFPLPFLLFGNVLAQISKLKPKLISSSIVVFLFLGLVYFHILGAPFMKPANKQKEQMKTIAEFVLSKTNGQPFNFALISSNNTDHAYRYFFHLEKKDPVVIENDMVDPGRKTVTNQLFIVCEEECSPLGHPLWEIAGFGKASIADTWEVSVVKVYKLVADTVSE